MTDEKKELRVTFQKTQNFSGKNFQKDARETVPPTQAFLTFFNVVRGYVGRGYGGSPPYVFHVEHNVKKT